MFQTLTQKLMLTASIFLVVVTITAVITITSAVAVTRPVDYLSQHTIDELRTHAQFELHIVRAIAEAQSFAGTHADEDRDEMQEASRHAAESLAKLGKVYDEPDGAGIALDDGATLQDQRRALLSDVQQQVTMLIRAVERHDEQAIDSVVEVLENTEEDVERIQEAEAEHLDDSITIISANVRRTIHRNIASAVSTLSVFVVLLVGAVLLVRRYIVGPLTRLAAASGVVATGDFDQAVQVTSTDEVGILQQAFNQMMATLKHQTVQLHEEVRVAETARAEAEAARMEVAAQLQTIQAQNAAIREMSVPLLPIMDKTLVMPLIGALDTARLQLIETQALHGLEQAAARHLILDVTGVPVIDTHVAQGLLRVVQAVRLLGAETVLVGIRPEVAQAIVGVGLDLSSITTRSTLETGISYTLRGVRWS